MGRRIPAIRALSLAALISATALYQPVIACTRLVYHGADNTVITARSMDWKVDVGTNIWVFPRGMQRSGEAGPNSVQWTSKYGSVIASGYDIATTDGMNEAGLVANVLWLVESSYTKPDGKTPELSLAAWAQYMLDNFASVGEAVAFLEREPLIVVTDQVPGEQRLATLHLSMSDAHGDSAIVEYIDGKQVIHHNRKYTVLTNSPTFDQQLALNTYWQGIGGTVMLPGTNRAADRYTRAAFYLEAIPKSPDPTEAIASVFSVIRNVSVPLGISTPDQPNISSTRWRTVSDHSRKLYFFESTVTPNIFWIDLKTLDFSEASGKVLKLDLGPDQRNIYSGMANDALKPSQPFQFLAAGAGQAA